MAAKKKTDSEPSFESDLEVLEKIVEELETGGLPLDVSITKFEEGMRLAQRCDKALSAAEKKIELLTKNADGELETKPFEESDAVETPASKPERKRRSPGAPGEESEGAGGKEPGALLF